MILRLTLDLPEDSTYIRTTRLLSQCLLNDLGVRPETIHDVESIVGELCSNVIRHAESKASHFLIVFEFYKPKIVITVTDKGKGFVMDSLPAPGTLRQDTDGNVRIGGYGLSLLEGLSDKVDFTETNPHGSTVRVEKNMLYATVEKAEEAAVQDKVSGVAAITTN
jgi:serine/threonine-protein kinase RsbW